MKEKRNSMINGRKTVVIIAALLLVGAVSAAPADVPRPGQTPGDAFYFLDRFSESLELAVASSPLGSPQLEAKVRANHAAERLSEAQKLAEENRTEKVDRLMDEYSQQLNRSVETARKANSTELSERLGNVTGNHVEVLKQVEQKVPEQARKGIQNAIEKSQRNRRQLEAPGLNREKPGRSEKENIPESGERTPETGNGTPENSIELPVRESGETGERNVERQGKQESNNESQSGPKPSENLSGSEDNNDSEIEDEVEESLSGKAAGKPSFSNR